MAFEARSLRVQLPCKSVTVIDAEDDGVELQVHRYWQAIAAGMLGGTDLDAGQCEECSANPSEPLCNNASEDLNLWAILDIRVLPVLRQQLEARLREIAKAEEAVAEATGTG